MKNKYKVVLDINSVSYILASVMLCAIIVAIKIKLIAGVVGL